MNDDQLRRRLRASDPAGPSRPVPPLPPDLLERTMSTPLLDRPTPARPVAPRRLALLGAAAAAVLVAGGVAVVSGGDPAPSSGGGTLALTVTPSDPLTSICAPFDAAVLAAYPVAFRGTATGLSDGTATLDVTRWYRGGDAATVTLAGPGSAALTGFEVVVGEEYLVTAQDGAVSGCGYSGAVTPELTAAYDAAF